MRREWCEGQALAFGKNLVDFLRRKMPTIDSPIAASTGDARMYNERVLDLTGGRVCARSSDGSGL